MRIKLFLKKMTQVCMKEMEKLINTQYMNIKTKKTFFFLILKVPKIENKKIMIENSVSKIDSKFSVRNSETSNVIVI